MKRTHETNVIQGNQLSSQWVSPSAHSGKGGEAHLRSVSASKASLRDSSSPTDVLVLCWVAPSESDRRVQEIATFMGARVHLFSLMSAALKAEASNVSPVPRSCCMIVEAGTLARISEAMAAGVNGLSVVLEPAENVLVYGFQPTEAHDAVLRVLSCNALAGTRPLCDADAKLNVAANEREWCHQFSGLSIGSVDLSKENSFVEGNAAGELTTLIRIGDRTFFAYGKKVGSRIFFLANSELADLDEKVTRHCSSLKWFCGLVPLMMFLRGSLKRRVWHNDHPRACFIIDDPLLRCRHGFLEYKRLLESVQRQAFSACIAFIPWNYRRSSSKVAELFLSNPGSVFLCVHGCDHTGAEFEARDIELLRGKAQLALDRMRKHQQLSGVPFDEIMVFPQGLFSVEAIPALKAAGYLAAVNTEVSPSTAPESLSLRNLLEVAVTRFAHFPVFGRRYPKEVAEFAFDLFLGKPALTAEHHGYFKDGHEALGTFIGRLKALDTRIEWTSLDTICSHACLMKMSESGDVHVRFYTDRFHLQNTFEAPCSYLLQQRRSAGETLLRVTVNGYPWTCQQEGDELKVHLSLEPGQTADIKISSDSSTSTRLPWKPSHAYNMGVWLRRVLCEVRDNYVDRSRILHRIVSDVRGLVSRHGIRPTTTALNGTSMKDRRALHASLLVER